MACLHGHKGDVGLLVHEGADVNAQGGEYGNALQAACYHGRKRIAELLIQKGAEINARSGRIGSVLRAACSKGNECIVRLLLDSGAFINDDGTHEECVYDVAPSVFKSGKYICSNTL